ncbi:MAG: hypothetical protein U0L26_08420 [Cellulosilyticum sp.]|nr:hypothetical protein [Cellulosilyticum sp.]
MTETNTEQLKKLFHQEIIDLYKQIIKSVKYKPTRLMDYINRYGGYEAAVKYISTESNVQDFAILWEKERLDLSVEALITKEQYRILFSEDILSFCDRKLKEYSYAPNKIEEVEETTGYFDEEEEEKIDLAELLKQKELYLPKMKKKEYPVYQKSVGITVEDWKRVLTNTKVVTANNLDLLLRIYAIGDQVGPKELSAEKGYSSTYPYKEVTTALGKRIKMELKVDVPTGEDGKPIWWHLLFNGGLKDNSAFEWSLKNDLRVAIKELIEAGKIEAVEVQAQKELQTVEEEQIVKIEKASENAGTKKEESLSAFDRLFEAIMSPTPTKEEVEEQPKVEKENIISPTKKIETHSEESQVEKTIVPIKEEAIQKIPTASEAKIVQPVEEIKEEVKLEETQPEEGALDYKARIKKECLEYYGAICDICGFDFGYTYGEAYEDCIEVHNVNGTDEEIKEDTHPVQDLIPVCCNCHRIIHSQNPPISVEKMRKIVKA